VRNYLPNIAYAALYLVMAGVFLFFFRAKNQPRYHKKWWVLLGVFLLLALAGNEAYKGVHQAAMQRIPSELNTSLRNSGSIASDELLYKSPDGYQIVIPQGLTYTESRGVVSLLAMNRNNQKKFFTLVVMKQSSTQPVDSLVKELVQAGAKASPPKKYVFEEKNKNADQRRGYIEDSKNGIVIKTTLLLVPHETSIYRVAISTLKDDFEQERAKIEKVLGSFKVL
jgi:hypothetical protein